MSAKSRIQAVIFDVDGVLVDSYEAHYVSWHHLLAETGIEYSRPEFRRNFGRRNREILRDLWPGGGELQAAEIEALADRKEGFYRDLMAEEFPAMPGAQELVDELAEAGFLLGVGSSGPPPNVDLVIDRLGRERFGAIVTGHDVVRGKPDPEVFLLGAEKLGVAPERCVVLEDAPDGLRAARAAGMATVAVASTGREPAEYAELFPDLLVRSPKELDAERLATLR